MFNITHHNGKTTYYCYMNILNDKLTDCDTPRGTHNKSVKSDKVTLSGYILQETNTII